MKTYEEFKQALEKVLEANVTVAEELVRNMDESGWGHCSNDVNAFRQYADGSLIGSGGAGLPNLFYLLTGAAFRYDYAGVSDKELVDDRSRKEAVFYHLQTQAMIGAGGMGGAAYTLEQRKRISAILKKVRERHNVEINKLENEVTKGVPSGWANAESNLKMMQNHVSILNRAIFSFVDNQYER